MAPPLVSVILPVYNGERYLRLAIESVFAQTRTDFELIVIDDGSVDSTPAIAGSYGSRLHYVGQQNQGVSAAFNHGLRLSKGAYISWLSHDDIYLPDKLSQQVDAIQRLAGPAVCYSDIERIDAHGNVFARNRLPEHTRDNAMRHVMTVGPICLASYSILYDRRCIDVVGPYAADLRYTQDIDMLARLARHFPFVRVPHCLVQVREHPARGGRSKHWEREISWYFSERLTETPLDQLFPDYTPVTASQRARAIVWLADGLARIPLPLYQRLAFGQYRRALSVRPALMPTVMLHYVRNVMHAMRLGLQSARAHPARLLELLRVRRRGD